MTQSARSFNASLNHSVRIFLALASAIAAILMCSPARAQYTPVSVTGFTADIIANGATHPGSTTADVDGGGYALLNQSFTFAGTPAFALPTSGLINSAQTPGLTFQLAPATGLNSLRLVASGSSGTLSFTSAQTAGIVYVLATSGSGASTITVAVNFADGTNQTFTGLTILDWFFNTPFTIQGIGRINAAGTPEGNATDPKLYQLALPLSLSNFTKPITGITVTKTSTAGFAQIMGVSIALPCSAPASQPTSLVLTAAGPGQINGSFTAPSPAADQYLVVRYPVGATPTAPVNGTSYTSGTTLGAGTIVYAGSASSFNAVGLTGSTAYVFYVYAYNATNCVGPIYNTTNPLTATQTTGVCSNLSGTIPVGPTGAYPTITAAMNALVAGISGPVVLELQSNYSSATETFPIVLTPNPCFNATNTLTIRPAAGATGLVITSSNTTATVDFNGSKYVTIDGRPGGTGTASELSIINTASTGVAIRFINDAQNNRVSYCDVQGQNTTVPANPAGTTAAGVIYFGGADPVALQGNDNNTISFCSVHATAGGFPAYGLLACGTTTTVASYNDNNSLLNNNIFDFFSAGSATTGVKLDAGTNAWTVNNNSFYQTASRTYTTGNTHRILWVTPNTGNISNTASGFVINSNMIGGSAPGAGGMYTIAGTASNVLTVMDLSVGLGTPTSVQGNSITNFDMAGTFSNPAFLGIGQSNGNVNVGTAIGNVIGATTGNNSIKLTTTATGGAAIIGYRASGGTGNTVNFANNSFGSITTIGSGTLGASILAFNATGGTNINFTNNLVGSLTTANSINASSATTGNTQSVTGFQVTGGTNTSITGNTIANLNNAYIGTGSGLTRGIAVSGSASVIANNTIRDLSSSSQSTNSGTTAAIVGINSNNTTIGMVISGNTIHSFRIASASAASNVIGIVFSGATTANSIVNRNFIHSFDIVTANNTVTLTGIDYATGTVSFVNNMIRLGIKPDGSSLTHDAQVRGISSNSSSGFNGFYFNSIYIGGTGVAASTRNSFAFTRTSTTGTYDIRNNIFVNNRSNAAGTGKHYAIFFTTANTGVSLDYNIYNATGTGGVFANSGTGDVATYTPGWISSDIHSYYADPLFVNPTGTSANVALHLQPGTIAEGSGIAVPSVTEDFDQQVRANLTPTDIGADAGNFGVSGIDVGVNALLTPATGACYGATETVSVQLKNYSTTAINFATTNVTVTATATGPVTYNSSIVLTTGSLAPGALMTVTLPATINLTAAGTYTFNASATATGDAQTGNNAMIAETRAVVAGSSLSGIYSVGAGQAAAGGFNTLTAAIAAYNSATCLGGNVVFNLTDALYNAASGETFPLVINNKLSSSTLTIRPAAGVAATVSGTSGTTASALIKLNGADNVIIDGIRSGGSSLAIENTSTTGGTAVIWVASQGLNAGAFNNVIRNLDLKAGVNQATSTTVTYGIVVAGNTLSATATSVTAGDDNDNNVIENNNIIKTRYAIYTRGGGTFNPSLGTIIRNNIIGPAAFGPDEIGKVGILSREEDGIIITGNEIRYVGGTFSLLPAGGTDRIGIAITTDGNWPSPTSVYFKNAVITNNKIHDVVEELTFSSAAISIAAADGPAPTNNIVANNMIWNILANGTSGDQVTAIGIGAGNTDRYVFNSIYLTGDVDPSASSAAPTTSGFGLVLSGPSVVNPVVANNIIYMDLSSSSASTLRNAAVSYPSPFSWGTGFANYNNLYINPANTQSYIGALNGSGGTYISPLSAWQAATGQEPNSVSILPPFVSPTNLHIDIALGFTVDNLGTPIAGVTTDIDGDTRNFAVPDIGADEFNVVTGIDFGAKNLVLPVDKTCYSAAETVTIRIRNYSANAHNFATIPVTVNASVTGINPVVFAPVVINTGTLAAGDTLDVVVSTNYNMSAVGSYTFNASTTVAADILTANNAMPATVRTLTAVAAGTITTTSVPYCNSGTPVLTLTGYNGNIQWQESSNVSGPWTNVGTNNATYVPSAPITATTYYQAIVSCNATSLTAAAVQVVVNTPQVLTTTPATRCGSGTATLTATASTGATLAWYTTVTGGTAIGTGTSFTTPVISATTTYYVAAEFSASACASARQAVTVTVNPAPSFDVTNNLTVCNTAVTTLQVTTPAANFNTYVWTPSADLYTDAAATIPYVAGASATTLYLKLTTPGTFTYIATANNTTTACQNIDSVKVTILPAAVTVVPSPDQLCTSGNSSISIQPSTSGFGAATYQWSSSANNVSYANITGATLSSYNTPVITNTTFYKVDIRNSAGTSCLTAYDTVIVNKPQILTSTPASLCGPGTLNLAATASAGATINWYAAAAGGAPLATGASFTTPALTGTTTYYAAAQAGSTTSNTGILLSDFVTCGIPTTNTLTSLALRFTTTKPVTVNSVYVVPAAAGAFTVALMNGTGTTTIQSVPVNFTAAQVGNPVLVPLNMTIAAPGNYQLVNTAGTGYRIAVMGCAYPISTASGGFSITGSATSPTATANVTTYNTFFQLNVTETCESARVAVVAKIDTAASIITQPVSKAVCAGANVSFSVTATGTGLSYQWKKGTAAITGATTNTLNLTNVQVSDGGSYSVDVIGTCGTITSTVVTLSVSATNSWLGAVSTEWNNAANWCGPVPTSTTDVVIPSGTPFSPVVSSGASVRNLTINSGASLSFTSAAQFNVYGNYSNIGTLTATTGFIYFRGTANQSVSAITANNVVIDGAGITLGGNMNATTLILQSGHITLGANNLTTSGSVNGTVGSHIVTNGTGSVISSSIGAGPVIIPVGPDAANYNPVMIANGQGRNYTVRVSTGITPAIGDPSRAVNRTWSVTPSTAVTSDVSVTMQFANAHGNANFNANGLVEVGLNQGGIWLIASPPNGLTPLGGVTERQVTVQTQSFGSMIVSSPGGLNIPTSTPYVNPDLTSIQLMPNPVINNAILRVVSARAMKMEWRICDVSGRIVRSFTSNIAAGTNSIELRAGMLTSGNYFITGVGDRGKTKAIRFIKL